ncbi:unnamed protein product [Calypogeia fissa]
MPRFSKRQRALRAVRHRVELSILLESSSSDSDGCAVDFEMPGFDAFDQNKFTADSSEGSLGLDSSSDSQHHYSDDEDDHPDCLFELYFVLYNTRLGHDGNGACLNHMIPTWGISSGSLVNFSKRCFRAP